MLVLAIDTAGPDCAVALARGDADDFTILARASERLGLGHAEKLMPMVEAALADASVQFEELDRIAVTTGPGSFTGVRVGIAAARGLALGLEIPVVGVSSLEALAAPVARRKTAGTVIATFDAKRGEVYALARDLASRRTLIDAAALEAGEIADRLRQAPRPIFITGSGASIVAGAFGGGDVIVSDIVEAPDIADVARLGLAAEDGKAPSPLYLRGADAKPQADKALARA